MNRFIPQIICFTLLIIEFIPTKIPGFSWFMPTISFIAIYYWSLYRPSNISYVFLFILGIIKDAISGVPFGITSISYIAFNSVMNRTRSKYFHSPLITIWLQFLLMNMMVSFIQWLLVMVSYKSLFAFKIILIQFIITTAIYPFFHQGFARINNKLSKDL